MRSNYSIFHLFLVIFEISFLLDSFFSRICTRNCTRKWKKIFHLSLLYELFDYRPAFITSPHSRETKCDPKKIYCFVWFALLELDERKKSIIHLLVLEFGPEICTCRARSTNMRMRKKNTGRTMKLTIKLPKCIRLTYNTHRLIVPIHIRLCVYTIWSARSVQDSIARQTESKFMRGLDYYTPKWSGTKQK